MRLLYPCCDTEPPRSSSRRGKVSRANLPPEFSLSRMVQDLENAPAQWTRDTPASQWTGVRVSPSGEVATIEWNGMELKGPMRWEHTPASVEVIACGWDRTRRLGLRNQLTGKLQLASLPGGLESLDLSFNELEGNLEAALLPRAMKKLDVEWNNFSGVFDFEAVPSSLVKLNLAHNMRLTGTCASLKYEEYFFFEVKGTGITIEPIAME